MRDAETFSELFARRVISQGNRLPNTVFANPFPSKRLDHESEKSGFRFDPKFGYFG